MLSIFTALAADVVVPESIYAPANVGVITRKQAAIWTPIVFVMITVAAVYALFAIDDKKNRDTILYAKFLANLKDK